MAKSVDASNLVPAVGVFLEQYTTCRMFTNNTQYTESIHKTQITEKQILYFLASRALRPSPKRIVDFFAIRKAATATTLYIWMHF